MPPSYFTALGVLLAMAIGIWGLATAKRNVGIVDIFWPLFFLAATLVHVIGTVQLAARGYLVLGLTAVWAARLSVYLAVRATGQPEDRRYQAIRARNEPAFAWKSLYLVFGFQAVLAWIISAPLAGAVLAAPPPQRTRCDRRRYRRFRHFVSSHCGHATHAVQSRSAQSRSGSGRRTMEIQPPPELLRGVLRLVGVLCDCVRRRRMVDALLACPHDHTSVEDLGRRPARERYRRA